MIRITLPKADAPSISSDAEEDWATAFVLVLDTVLLDNLDGTDCLPLN